MRRAGNLSRGHQNTHKILKRKKRTDTRYYFTFAKFAIQNTTPIILQTCSLFLNILSLSLFCIGFWLKLIHFLSVSTCNFNEYCLRFIWFCFVDAYKWVSPHCSTSEAICTARTSRSSLRQWRSKVTYKHVYKKVEFRENNSLFLRSESAVYNHLHHISVTELSNVSSKTGLKKIFNLYSCVM
jgi:hypothetical protein